MPIHNFGPFKKLEDVEKEVEEGKACEMPDLQMVRCGGCGLGIPSAQIPFHRCVKETSEDEEIPNVSPKSTKKSKTKETPKPKKKSIGHPMVHGLLEIEEEEL